MKEDRAYLSSEAQIGEIFFKYRDYSPIPLILLLLVVGKPGVVSASTGLFLLFLGEFLRLYSVSFIGPKSRTRSRSLGSQLVEDGPYALTRNPLYLANFLICLGFSFYSGKIWFVLLSGALFYTQYHFIIRFEEELLAKEFPESYFSYCERVPRLFPKKMPELESLKMTEDFFESFRTEKRTLTAISILWILLLLFHSS